MKKVHLLFLFAIAGMAGASCRMNVMKGEGKRITANPEVTSFNAVKIEVPFKVDIAAKDSARPAVQISGYENIMKHIVAKVENNTLRVYCDLGEIWTVDYDDFSISITAPSLKAVTLSGAPEADIHGVVTGSDFTLDVTGAGRIGIDSIHVNKLVSQVTGAADIEINGGYAGAAVYNISGAGKIGAFPMLTETTTVTISGAGKGDVNVTQKLEANISGAGSIKYKGHPAVVQDVSGAGTVQDVN